VGSIRDIVCNENYGILPLRPISFELYVVQLWNCIVCALSERSSVERGLVSVVSSPFL